MKGITLPVYKEPPAPEKYIPLGHPLCDGNPFIECIASHIHDAPNFSAEVAMQLPTAPKNGVSVGINPILASLGLHQLPEAVYPTPLLHRTNDRTLELLLLGLIDRNPLNSV
jgi:hypothetical protein